MSRLIDNANHDSCIEWAHAFGPRDRLRLVAYDIAGARDRRRMDAMLRERGYRLQKSVFGLDADTEALKVLLGTMTHLRMEASASVLVVPICSACAGKARVRGGLFEAPVRGAEFVL